MYTSCWRVIDVVFAELDIWLGGISWESKKLVSH